MSQTSHKIGQKMCKSPKNSNSFQNTKIEKMDYENLSTNCTVVGSNNLNLVKKQQINTNMSPAYSNPSPGYPPSPYSSPASLKSPSPSLKPPTPQPSFPVMQLIHNSLLARPVQTSQQQNIIKLKPHLNILPKPSASPQPSPKPSVSPQIVLPTNHQQAATIMPTAQPLLLNQMSMLTAPSVQFILRPQTAKIPSPMQTATATPQGLILQPSGQPLLQIQPPRSQPMMRVLTNGMQLAPTTTAYVTNPPLNSQQVVMSNHINTKKKPKTKIKKKLDLANIMKLSGIGDEDDIQFESDTSQSESEPNTLPNTPHSQANVIQTSVHTHSNLLQTSDTKKIGNIQISSISQPAPVVQVLNQNFQSGVIANTTSQAAAAHSGIPFSPFITPNFTINNGLMVQRSGGFKLTVGEDGRLVLQHDPTLNQDLQSQLILQSIFGLNGGLVLQPSMDQQTVQQTVQTIQQQSVQTIQQQTVQSQTIQTVQQALQPQIQQQTIQQTFQHQTVQSQPSGLQQPLQIVQPQPIQAQVQPSMHHSIHSQVQSLQSQIQGQIQSLLQNQGLQAHHQPNVHPTVPSLQSSPLQGIQNVQPQPPVNIPLKNLDQNHTPKKLQYPKSHPITTSVNSQPVQAASQTVTVQENHNNSSQTSYVVNLTPDQLEHLKRNGQLTINGQTIFMQRRKSQTEMKKLSPKTKPLKKINKVQNNKAILTDEPVKMHAASNTIETKPEILPPIAVSKHTFTQNIPAPSPTKISQPTVINSSQTHPKPVLDVKPSKASVLHQKNNMQHSQQQTDPNGPCTDVERLLGQLLDESNSTSVTVANTNTLSSNVGQRIHTIQLTPQKQQHLKSIQLQIQTLSARLTPGDTEMQHALKMLFNEQQKILASGKLLPPDKVYYHNNQLTIVNPSTLGLASPTSQSKCDSSPVHSNNNKSPPDTHQVVSGSSHINSKVPVAVPPATNVCMPSNNCSLQNQVPIQRLGAPPQQYLSKNTLLKKAHLIETQLDLDQNEAIKPDIHTPFRDKKDACIRLIRFHCMDQPVLSHKDLAKADEIFELTAKHFIGKYARMVDKYKYLLMKESMRQVQTSELMMLDRMYLAEEQQSLMRLRQEVEEGHLVGLSPRSEGVASSQSGTQEPPQDDYDEWACIQRELGCLSSSDDKAKTSVNSQTPSSTTPTTTQTHTAHAQKRTASSDSRLETLKRFRVEKHNKKTNDSVNNSVQSVNSNSNHNQLLVHMNSSVSQGSVDASHSSLHNNIHCHESLRNQLNESGEGGMENNSLDEQVQSAIDSILNLQQNTSLDLDSILS